MDVLKKIFLLFLIIVTGCNTSTKEIPSGFPLKIDNVYANPTYSHTSIYNTLLIPIDNPLFNKDLQQKQLILSILRNFGKFNYFYIHYDPNFKMSPSEIVNLNSGTINRMKLGAIKDRYGVQAILATSIVDYSPYPPMRMKIIMSLIDTNTGEKIWIFDYSFNAINSNVKNAMKLWWNDNISGSSKNHRFDSSTIQPSLFMDFVFHTAAKSYAEARKKNIEIVEKAKLDWEEKNDS